MSKLHRVKKINIYSFELLIFLNLLFWFDIQSKLRKIWLKLFFLEASTQWRRNFILGTLFLSLRGLLWFGRLLWLPLNIFGGFVFVNLDALFWVLFVFDVLEECWIFDDLLISQWNFKSAYIVLVIQEFTDLKWFIKFHIVNFDILDIVDHFQRDIELIVLEKTREFSRLLEQLM